jgi:hypothetical protein
MPFIVESAIRYAIWTTRSLLSFVTFPKTCINKPSLYVCTCQSNNQN